MKKVIAVLGATGQQGGAVVQAILADKSGEFEARAITRDPNSTKAQALAAQGVSVVQGDVNDVDGLTRAFEGAYGAFCVTFFFEHMSPEKELMHVEAMAKAAKATGVKHVVWSTLEDTREMLDINNDTMPTLMEKYNVPHFDVKGEADGIFKGMGLPVTLLRTSFYFENLFSFGPKPMPDGKLAITMPMGDKKLPGVSTEDIGKCALAIFKKPDMIGQTIAISGDNLTVAEMCEKMSAALGQTIVYNEVPADVYRSFGFPGADELGNMFQYKRDFNEQFCGQRDVAATRALNPELQSFDDWLAKNASKIPLE